MSEYLYTHDALTVPRGDDAGQLLAPRPPCDADSQLDVAAFREAVEREKELLKEYGKLTDQPFDDE